MSKKNKNIKRKAKLKVITEASKRSLKMIQQFKKDALAKQVETTGTEKSVYVGMEIAYRIAETELNSIVQHLEIDL